MVHFAVGVHRPLTFDLFPARFERGAPRAGRGRRIAQSTALRAGLQMKVVLSAVTEILGVLDIEIVDGERHAQIFAANSHFVSPSTISSVIPAKAGTQGAEN